MKYLLILLLTVNLSYAQKNIMGDAAIGTKIKSLTNEYSQTIKVKNNQYMTVSSMSKERYYSKATGKYKKPQISLNGNSYTVYRDNYYVTFIPKWATSNIVVENRITKNGVKENIIITSKINKLQWDVDTNANYNVNNNIITFIDNDGDVLFTSPEPFGIDNNDDIFPVYLTYLQNTLTYIFNVKEELYPILIDPSMVFGDIDTASGLVGNTQSPGRNQTTGDQTSASQSVLRWDCDPSAIAYYRIFLTFDTTNLPENCYIDSAKVVVDWTLTGGTYKTTACLVNGTFTGALTPTWVNDFDGWQSSGVYPVSLIADTVSVGDVGADSTIYKLTDLSVVGKADSSTFVFIALHDIKDINFPSGNDHSWNADDDFSYFSVWYRLTTSDEMRYLRKNNVVTRIMKAGSPARKITR